VAETKTERGRCRRREGGNPERALYPTSKRRESRVQQREAKGSAQRGGQLASSQAGLDLPSLATLDPVLGYITSSFISNSFLLLNYISSLSHPEQHTLFKLPVLAALASPRSHLIARPRIFCTSIITFISHNNSRSFLTSYQPTAPSCTLNSTRLGARAFAGLSKRSGFLFPSRRRKESATYIKLQR
jgi:hypothetical protein